MDSTLIIRPANEADIGAMTTIAATAAPLDQMRYCFPQRDVYHDDHLDYLRSRQAGHIANFRKGTHAVMLAEAPCNKNPSVREVVALSVWQLPGAYTTNADGTPKGKWLLVAGLWAPKR